MHCEVVEIPKLFDSVDQGWAMKAMKVTHIKLDAFEHCDAGYFVG